MKYVVRSERGHVIKGPHDFEVAVEIAGNLVRAGKVVAISPCPDHAAEWEEQLREMREANRMTKEYRAFQWTGADDEEARRWLTPTWGVETITEHPVSGDRSLFVRTDKGLVRVDPTDFMVRLTETELAVYPAKDVEVVGQITTTRFEVEITESEVSL
jgi:hypothetical protein